MIKISRQDILEEILLIRGQAGRELDIDANNQITTVAGLLGDHHTPAGVPFLVAGLGRSWLGNTNRFAVNGAHDALPARQGFFESKVDGCHEVVTGALEGRVLLLWNMLATTPCE